MPYCRFSVTTHARQLCFPALCIFLPQVSINFSITSTPPSEVSIRSDWHTGTSRSGPAKCCRYFRHSLAHPPTRNPSQFASNNIGLLTLHYLACWFVYSLAFELWKGDDGSTYRGHINSPPGTTQISTGPCHQPLRLLFNIFHILSQKNIFIDSKIGKNLERALGTI